MKSILTLISLAFFFHHSHAQDLEKHRWRDRLILLFASSDDDDRLLAQLKILNNEQAELIERDLKIYVIMRAGGLAPAGEKMEANAASALRQRYQVEQQAFTFLLIGKDGGVKLRRENPVTIRELFDLIDSMPMRRAEMRREDGR
jgi:hypothetical protein